MAVIVAGVILAVIATPNCAAQETTKPADPPQAPAPQAAPKAAAKVPGSGLYNLLDRKSMFFPDIAASTEPLTAGQKCELFVDNSISLHSVAWAAMGAAVGQAANSPTGWGQGWEAYGKRFGGSMARQASEEFFGTFVLASALHQDPRFFPDANPSFGRAVSYSVERIFVTRTDDGRRVANISGLLGPAMAEGLANAYYPDRNRTVGDTFLRYGIDLAVRAGGNMMREYWPVVFGKIRGSGSSGKH